MRILRGVGSTHPNQSQETQETIDEASQWLKYCFERGDALMENEFVLDLEEVIQSIDNAEVVSLYFPTLSKAFVVDTRSTDTEGPLVRIMPMVASPQERLQSLQRLRPFFPDVRNLTVIAWPRYVDSLVRLGVWERIVSRVGESGHDEAVSDCDSVLKELRRLEKAELAAVVLGESYHTIWSREAV